MRRMAEAFVPFSEVDVLFVARELRPLQGLRVESALRTGPLELILLLEKGNALRISAHPQRFRVHLTGHLEGTGHPVSPLEQALRGFRLHRVAVPRGERILLLEFTGTSRLGEHLSRILAVELMGRYSQVVLLGPDRRILWTLKTVSPALSRVRTLEVGGTYRPPPAKPWSLTDPERNPEALRQQVRRVFPVPETEDPVPFLKAYLQRALQTPRPGLFQWQKRWIVLPHPVPGLNPMQATDRLSEAWDLLIQQLEGRLEAREPSARLLRRLQEELERLARYPHWNQVAEEILLRRDELLATGTLEIPLPDGTRETITLAPGETPESLSARYRERAARWRRGYERVRQRLQELTAAPGDARPAASSSPETGVPPARYQVYRSPSGFLVYVGKNARGNEEITFRLATPDDYFFHARGVPGAHVVLKTGRQTPREADLLFAARLALQHSRAAADGKGEVSYTQVRYLRRPRGRVPGLVILTREQVLQVRL